MIKRFAKFAVVGGLGTFINLGVFTALTLGGTNYIIASILSFCIAVTSNYIFNHIWVFNDREQNHSKTLMATFLTVSIFSLGINLGILIIMEKFIMPYIITLWLPQEILKLTANILNVTNLTRVATLYSQAFGIGASMMFNFLGNNFITFKKK